MRQFIIIGWDAVFPWIFSLSKVEQLKHVLRPARISQRAESATALGQACNAVADVHIGVSAYAAVPQTPSRSLSVTAR